jgi:hypothetical protein
MLDNCSIAWVPEDNRSEDAANHCNPQSAGFKNGQTFAFTYAYVVTVGYLYVQEQRCYLTLITTQCIQHRRLNRNRRVCSVHGQTNKLESQICIKLGIKTHMPINGVIRFKVIDGQRNWNCWVLMLP